MMIRLEVNVERMSGKFMAKSEVAEVLLQELEAIGEVEVDESVYEIIEVVAPD